MKTPESLVTAVDCGIIQEVVRPLMSGKEAQIFVVVADGSECVAKVYKEASQRTFKHRSEYTEGRRTRNSRDQRAINKRSRHGRTQDESGWRSTEVDMIYRLRDAGVRVPAPINFVDGVLVMELVKDADGNPAPRLGDLRFEADEAREIYQRLLREVARMLCAGVIHGDLSDFNVLMGADGPVLIDFPQSMEAARNQNARKFLLRDVENLHRFVERYSSGSTHPYGEEMWSLYEANRLEPDTPLRGDYHAPDHAADTKEVLALIDDADRDEHMRREARGETPVSEAPRPLRTVVDFTKDARGAAAKRAGERPAASKRPAQRPGAASKSPAERSGDASKASGTAGDGETRKRRSRRGRGRRRGGRAGSEGGADTTTRNPRGDASSTGRNDQGDTGTKAPRSRAGATTTEKKTVSSTGGEGAERPRRGRRGRRRSGSGNATAGAQAKIDRPAKPDASQRGASRSPVAGDGAERPARRRRRRPAR